MFVSEDLQVNAQGHLTIGGQDTVELAKQYGTPLYVMDVRPHPEALSVIQAEHGQVLSGQGLSLLCQQGILLQGNLSGDAGRRIGRRRCFRGELYTAMQTGFDSSKIVSTATQDTEELQMALDYQVGRIIVD